MTRPHRGRGRLAASWQPLYRDPEDRRGAGIGYAIEEPGELTPIAGVTVDMGATLGPINALIAEPGISDGMASMLMSLRDSIVSGELSLWEAHNYYLTAMMQIAQQGNPYALDTLAANAIGGQLVSSMARATGGDYTRLALPIDGGAGQAFGRAFLDNILPFGVISQAEALARGIGSGATVEEAYQSGQLDRARMAAAHENATRLGSYAGVGVQALLPIGAPVVAGTGFGGRALSHAVNLGVNGLAGFADGYLTDGTLSAATQGALFGALPTVAAEALPSIARIDVGAYPLDIAGALAEDVVNQHLDARNRSLYGDTYGWQGIAPTSRPADGFYFGY